MIRLDRFFAVLVVGALFLGAAMTASAVPYASSVRNTGGTNWEFILNENAENVTILRDSSPLDLGALGIGRHSFSMAGFSDFEITVTNTTPVSAWTPIVNPSSGLHADFEQTVGVVINSNPASEYFGVIYVGNSQETATASGRSMGDGVYALTANQIGVNLDPASIDYTYYGETFHNDTTLAKKPGWTVGGTTSAPWKMTIDESDNLVVADWSDTSGGIKYASGNLVNGGLVLATESGPFGGVTTPVDGQALHGSIASKPYVTGSVGVDLQVWALDEDMHESRNPTQVSGAHGNHIWRWNVGSATASDVVPQLVIDTTSVLPTPSVPRTTDNRLNWLSINTGITSNAHYNAAEDVWYLSENRFDGQEAGLAVFSGTGELLWSSLQWAIDNNQDGNTGLATGGASCNGDPSCAIQDPFRGMGGGMTVSPDGTKLYLQTTDRRESIRASNPVFGTHADADPALKGEILVIPLDANGIPNIQVAGGEITNMQTISIGAGASSSSRRDLAVDIAGNVYIVDSNPEKLFVFSPGGASQTTTKSDGTFCLGPCSIGLPGDHNGDNLVDAADYVAWRKIPERFGGDPGGYNVWRENFGPSATGSGGSGAVPEPMSVVLVAMGLAGLVVGRRERR